MGPGWSRRAKGTILEAWYALGVEEGEHDKERNGTRTATEIRGGRGREWRV